VTVIYGDTKLWENFVKQKIKNDGKPTHGLLFNGIAKWQEHTLRESSWLAPIIILQTEMDYTSMNNINVSAVSFCCFMNTSS